MRRAPTLLVALAAVAAPSVAAAQRGIDVNTFRPAVDGFGLFAIERAETS